MHVRSTLGIGGTAAALTALAAEPALAQSSRPEFWNMGYGWGHMMFGGLTMLLFWGALIVVVILAIRWLGFQSHTGSTGPSVKQTSLQILEERFARGEIDEEEFQARRRTLQGDGT